MNIAEFQFLGYHGDTDVKKNEQLLFLLLRISHGQIKYYLKEIN